MTAGLEIEPIFRVRIDIRVALGGLISPSELEYIVPLTKWMNDEFARRPILVDLLEVAATGGRGGAVYFDSRADYRHGQMYDGIPATRVLSIVVGTGAAITQNLESLEVDSQAPLLVWLVGEDALDSLFSVHHSQVSRTRRTVADPSLSPELFVEICRGLVRAAVGGPAETCAELIESTALSAAMRGLGYVVS
ncbi:hypothetical protein [Rhodococcus sp. OK302]|uniref:hypothetical protein n=1 Tax=Rhodococcus sp. OK302 TaxID=1882769 RepID=UPI000B94353F|nr:hypothetical protein [Rhodococcus sp. OK302]OYD71409.1 hypothetical protein BDB13_5081 [Rhodococcus sp. OK302]